jgi:hypothetical protein
VSDLGRILERVRRTSTRMNRINHELIRIGNKLEAVADQVNDEQMTSRGRIDPNLVAALSTAGKSCKDAALRLQKARHEVNNYAASVQRSASEIRRISEEDERTLGNADDAASELPHGLPQNWEVLDQAADRLHGEPIVEIDSTAKPANRLPDSADGVIQGWLGIAALVSVGKDVLIQWARRHR